MSRRAQENAIALVLLALFVAVLVMSFGYGPRARLVPVPIAILGIVLTVAQIVWQNLRPADELHVDVLEMVAGREGSERRAAARSEAAAAEGTGLVAGDAPGRRGWLGGEAAAFGVVASLLALFLLLGPIPAIFLFSAGYFILSGHATWLRGLVHAFVCTASLYLIFGYVLGIQLNRGAAAPFIGQFVNF